MDRTRGILVSTALTLVYAALIGVASGFVGFGLQQSLNLKVDASRNIGSQIGDLAQAVREFSGRAQLWLRRTAL